MSRAVEIYPIKRQLERELKRARKDPHNGEVLINFCNQRKADGISPSRTYKCVNTLLTLSAMLGKPYQDASKQDIVNLVAKFESMENLSEWTKRDYKKILKHFYKWLRNSDVPPEEVRWMKKLAAPANKTPIMPKDLLTADEKKAMIRAARNPRDRALIEVFSESGRRFGELLTLHIGDVEFDESGAKLHVNGKVGEDYARIITASAALAIWLDMHPLRDDPNAPVWIGFGSSNHLSQLSAAAARSVLKKIARRAGIKGKRVHFYLFRHTRIDETQGILTESQQCSMFGWRFGSRMPAVYFKRAGRHIDEAQAIMNGITPPKREVIASQGPKECGRCRMRNSPAAKFCNRCGIPLDVETAVKLDDARRLADQLLDEIMEDPKNAEKLRSRLLRRPKPSKP